MRRIYFKGNSNSEFLTLFRMLNKFIIAETTKLLKDENCNLIVIEEDGYKLAKNILENRIISSKKVNLYKVEFKGNGRREITNKINNNYEEVYLLSGPYDEYLDEESIFTLNKGCFVTEKEYNQLKNDKDILVTKQKNLLKIKLYSNTINKALILEKLEADIGGVYDIKFIRNIDGTVLDFNVIVDYSKLSKLNSLLYVKVKAISIYNNFKI